MQEALLQRKVMCSMLPGIWLLAYRSGLAIVNAQMLLQRGVYSPGSAQHARSGPADHYMVFADLAAVEHGVECGHLRQHVHAAAVGWVCIVP